MTRGGVYNEILPEPEGFPEGSGNISSYTLTRVTIQLFLITSTNQYFLVLTPWACNIFSYSPCEQVNTGKYWLVELIENGCIVTRVRVYDEILPEPSGNPSSQYSYNIHFEWLRLIGLCVNHALYYMMLT